MPNVVSAATGLAVGNVRAKHVWTAIELAEHARRGIAIGHAWVAIVSQAVIAQAREAREARADSAAASAK